MGSGKCSDRKTPGPPGSMVSSTNLPCCNVHNDSSLNETGMPELSTNAASNTQPHRSIPAPPPPANWLRTCVSPVYDCVCGLPTPSVTRPPASPRALSHPPHTQSSPHHRPHSLALSTTYLLSRISKIPPVGKAALTQFARMRERTQRVGGVAPPRRGGERVTLPVRSRWAGLVN